MSFLESEETRSEKYKLNAKDGKVIISSDNVSKVFAMVSDSPQYKCSCRINDKTTAAYLYIQWKESRTITDDDLLTLLERLNRENNTRVDGNTLKEMTNRISNKLTEVESALKKPDYAIIETIAKTGSGQKTPFSLATKFCHYACMFLLDGEARDNFPIFDSIVRKNLGRYSETWEKACFVGTRKHLRNLEGYSELTPEELTFVYSTYVEALKELAKKHGVSKTGVEQLIWYYHNGNYDYGSSL